ncbi:MAG: 4Fe-4S binding protein [Dehalococcoidia bacterium]
MKKVIQIDKEKCNGCGLCVQACMKGFLYIYNGKALQKKGAQCDGDGACAAECPQNAITLMDVN